MTEAALPVAQSNEPSAMEGFFVFQFHDRPPKEAAFSCPEHGRRPLTSSARVATEVLPPCLFFMQFLSPGTFGPP